jgi:hypothetical protein
MFAGRKTPLADDREAPAELAESTAKAERLVENLQPLADVSFEIRAATETAFASSSCRKQQKG